MKLAPNILSFEAKKAMDDEAIANGMWRSDRRVFLPGMGWYNNWYWDPADGSRSMCRKVGNPFLSVHYWRDWANKRPPIELVCPDGTVWCPDRKSSNGEGWVVTGEWPNITASPSIECNKAGESGNYHGFLKNGEFTPDLGGKTWPIPNIPADYGRK